VPTISPPSHLDPLRAAVVRATALPALGGERYALTHAAYEAASDQRRLLQAWLAREVPPLLAGRDPLRVVGVGVGDGTVDAALARALAAGGGRVRYTGVEPHPPSALGFAGRLAALDSGDVTPAVVIGDFAEHDPGHAADLVHFVHSLYYVEDLGAALDHALSMTRPGGLLLTATAPREPLCVLTELLCPWGSHRPRFAAEVRAELDALGLDVRVEQLAGRLDLREALADPLGRGEAVLDFLVGARTAAMTPEVREQLLAYLAAISLPGSTGVVPHPLEITVTRVP
jgi:SAM-dependent methyltransferase